MWTAQWSTVFTKQYKNLSSQVRIMTNKAILEITSSKNPADLGVYKPNKKIFSYELGRKYRIIYSIHYGEGIVVMLRVCDHKSVYGMD